MPNDRRPRRLFRFPWRSAEHIADEIDTEVSFHLAMREGEMLATGMSPAQAQAAARDKFGDVADMKRYCRALDTRAERARRVRERVDSVWHDLRYAVRQLGRAPAFTATVIVTLALGIGANVAIVSVVYRLLVAPLPFPEGDRLVTLVRSLGDQQLLVTPTPAILSAVRERARSLEWVAAFEQQEVALGSGSDAQLLDGVLIEPALMKGLGLPPSLGRGFLEEETVPNGPPVVILGHGLWRSRFGGDRGVLGTTIPVDGVPHTIVGVAARDFDVLSFGSWAGGELWRPYAITPELRGLSVLGKLRSGVTIDQATRELAAIGTSLEQNADESRFALRAMPAQSETSGSTKRALLLLMGAVSVVLLIACANVASLLLIRAAAREREIGVRIALGAGRGRLARQMLTESLMLALLGGAAGLLVAWYGLQLLIAARPESLTALSTVRLEPAVLGWCLTISILCGVVFGLAPMMVGAHRVDLLKGARTVSGTVRSHRTRSALVTLEVALSVTLLVGAGLLVRSVQSMQQQDLGFEPEGLLSIGVILPEDRYASREARLGAFDRILGEVGRIPGIGTHTIAAGVPPNTGITFGAIQVEGRTTGSEAPEMVAFNMVPPDYFRMLGIAFREGSTFGTDTAEAAIINETMAARLWPGESALGRRFRVGDRGAFNTIVGIVADVRSPGKKGGAHELQMYRPFSASWHRAHLIIHPTREMDDLLGRVIQVVGSVDPTIKVRDAQTIESALAKGIAAERFSMRLLAGFALLALVLSAVGLYGVIAYGVAQRTRELGMRIALGAMPRDVLKMVVRQGLKISIVGVGLGLAAAAAATRTMESLLFEVDSLDPATYVGVAVAILLVALLATVLPARRAASVDPIAALRAD